MLTLAIVMAVTFKRLFVIMAITFTTNGFEGLCVYLFTNSIGTIIIIIVDSCLTFSELSCSRGTKRGLTTQNSRETRLIPAMEFNCTGTLMGLTVSGRNGTGTMYPKLQIWRRSTTDTNLY